MRLRSSMQGYLIYIVFIVLGLSCFLIPSFMKNKKYETLFLLVILFFFFLIAILKSSNVGIDSITYENIYATITKRSFTNVIQYYNPEFAFYLPMYFLSLMRAPYIVFKIYAYSLICLFLFLSFFRRKHYIFELILLFFIGFFSMCFSALRQGIAMSIICYAFSLYIFESKIKKPVIKDIIFIAIILFASLFHSSSIFCLLILPFFHIKIQPKYLVFFFIFLPFLPRLFAAFINLINDIVITDYVVYSSRLSYRMFLFIIIAVVFLLLKDKKVHEKIKIDRFLFYEPFLDEDLKMFFISFFCIVFSSFNIFSQIMARLSFFFLPGSGFLISKITSGIKNKKIEILIESIVIVVFGLYFLYDTKTLGIYPYEFLWQ